MGNYFQDGVIAHFILAIFYFLNSDKGMYVCFCNFICKIARTSLKYLDDIPKFENSTCFYPITHV